ncbi:TetR family transcriptional regulator, partial [Streptomyces sp. NPDC060000]|uniref:TetR family transcriptional regulator n=1 Tax=Streptomyces sp. NPDC060000 TaxID=3347031 RepID=UPI00369D5F4C
DAREKILSAARSLIELRGYSALGVAEMCKAAAVPKGGGAGAGRPSHPVAGAGHGARGAGRG